MSISSISKYPDRNDEANTRGCAASKRKIPTGLDTSRLGTLNVACVSKLRHKARVQCELARWHLGACIGVFQVRLNGSETTTCPGMLGSNVALCIKCGPYAARLRLEQRAVVRRHVAGRVACYQTTTAPMHVANLITTRVRSPSMDAGGFRHAKHPVQFKSSVVG